MTNPFFENLKFSSLTIADFVFFATLYQTLSLTETASLENMSLSTASRNLKKLRETFDDPLFLRSSPELIPTARAVELFPKVLSLISEVQSFEPQETFDPATLTRTFRIGVVDNAIYSVMTNVVEAFFKTAPHAGLSFSQMSDTLFDDLANGELDCAVYPATRLSLIHI